MTKAALGIPCIHILFSGRLSKFVTHFGDFERHSVFVELRRCGHPRNDLSLAVQRAFSQIQQTTTIGFDYLTERMGIELPSTAKPSPEPSTSSAVAAVNLAFERVPYDRLGAD